MTTAPRMKPLSIRGLRAEIEAELEPAVNLLGRLIAEPSVEGSDAIGRAGQLIAAAVRPLGGREAVHSFDGVPNLVVEWGSPDSEHRLLLTGHADVVPADGPWRSPPFEMTRAGSTLTGRGVADMKGGLAAYVGALKVLARAGVIADTPVSLVVTGDEEIGSDRGMRPLISQAMVAGRWAVAAEPTDLDIYTGNRGRLWLRIGVTGRGGHAGFPHACANPMPVVARLITALGEIPLTAENRRFDPPAPSLTVTSANVDGHAVSDTIPTKAWVAVDRRVLPGETDVSALEPIRQVVSSIVAPPFTAEIEISGFVPPYLAAEDDPLIAVARQAALEAGRPGNLSADLATDDSTWLGNAGISTILCGPGEPEQAHTVDERIDVADIRDAIGIFAGLCLAAWHSDTSAAG